MDSGLPLDKYSLINLQPIGNSLENLVWWKSDLLRPHIVKHMNDWFFVDSRFGEGLITQPLIDCRPAWKIHYQQTSHNGIAIFRSEWPSKSNTISLLA